MADMETSTELAVRMGPAFWKDRLSDVNQEIRDHEQGPGYRAYIEDGNAPGFICDDDEWDGGCETPRTRARDRMARLQEKRSYVAWMLKLSRNEKGLP